MFAAAQRARRWWNSAMVERTAAVTTAKGWWLWARPSWRACLIDGGAGLLALAEMMGADGTAAAAANAAANAGRARDRFHGLRGWCELVEDEHRSAVIRTSFVVLCVAGPRHVNRRGRRRAGGCGVPKKLN